MRSGVWRKEETCLKFRKRREIVRHLGHPYLFLYHLPAPCSLTLCMPAKEYFFQLPQSIKFMSHIVSLSCLSSVLKVLDLFLCSWHGLIFQMLVHDTSSGHSFLPSVFSTFCSTFLEIYLFSKISLEVFIFDIRFLMCVLWMYFISTEFIEVNFCFFYLCSIFYLSEDTYTILFCSLYFILEDPLK